MALATLALVTSSCSSLLYHPWHGEIIPPSKMGLEPRTVWFRSEDGTFLHGWYMTNKRGVKPKALLVFFHGNAENLSSHYMTLSWLLEHDYDYFIFDYRGYGESQGKPYPEGTILDGRSALRWAHAERPDVPLVVYGQSLGGAIALRSALDLKKELSYALVVADSTFLSYRSAARSVLARHWITWPFQAFVWLALSDEFAPRDDVAALAPTPLLVIHGDSDTVIDFDLGESLFERAREPKEFWRVPGGRHTDVFWGKTRDEFRQKFLEKLTSSLPKTR